MPDVHPQTFESVEQQCATRTVFETIGDHREARPGATVEGSVHGPNPLYEHHRLTGPSLPGLEAVDETRGSLAQRPPTRHVMVAAQFFHVPFPYRMP